ncbi:MAG: hypothetical protein HQL36_05035 [Alphaproteobacteria bacterium]|nr:hypothetical protein [Alphaproteobacteria bacterium]MBF0249842.1 hypothetical protein [Alphaproteobacteria bacterium]
MIRNSLGAGALILAAFSLMGCQTDEVILSKKGALELRNMQSRVYETGDQSKVYRAVLSVMQDLGYAITTVEPEAGVVSGNKLALLDLTAAINEKQDERTVVRANAIVRTHYQQPRHQVDSAEFYQQRFFEPLSQALFLDALYDEDPAPAEEVVNAGDQKTPEETRSNDQ